METLKLTLEAADAPPGSEPGSVIIQGPVFRVGRKAGNDWVLPDPNRLISGVHFEIRSDENAYFISDLSTNGTFLNGSKQRLSAPHQIADGDVIRIGTYTVVARLAASPGTRSGAGVQAPAHATLAQAQGQTSKVRRSPAVVVPARPGKSAGIQAPPGAQQKPVGGNAPQPDAGRPAPPNQATPDSEIKEPKPPVQQDPLEPAAHSSPMELIPDDDFHLPGPFSDETPPEEPALPEAEVKEPESPPAPRPDLDVTTGLESQPPVGLGERFGDAAPLRSDPLPGVKEPPSRVPSPPASPEEPVADSDPGSVTPDKSDAFLRGFLEGAGLDPETTVDLSPEDLGRVLGRCARTGTEALMQMLTDRSAVKLLVVHEDRTMLTAKGNNPLKFMPDPDDAFDAMFIALRQGYMNGADGFENALTDVRRHNAALMAAIQPALAEMLEGMSPDEISAGAGGGVLGGSRRKNWDEFVSRWEERASQGENGMLDAFLQAFARHYSEALRTF